MDGRVAVRFDFGTGPQEVVQDTVLVGDCDWHSVAVSYRGVTGVLTLTVDGTHVRMT